MAAQVVNTRYEIIETTPEADTAPFVVSKARDLTEDRIVSLQTLPDTRQVTDSGTRAAFRVRVTEALRLDHANIVHVYDQGDTEAGDLFVATEFVRGITLRERIRRVAPFSLTVATDIAIAIAEALTYAYRAGVLHGALRPQHVLLSPEGQIKVGGFAYARIADLLADGKSAEDRAFAAPELGAGGEPTVGGDIYALGATLYQMLTGVLPPPASQNLPSPREQNSGVPPALEGIVQKAMHPDTTLRYRTAATLLADLQAVRDALRSGRSLAWSPLAEKRLPRPSASDATMVGDRPPSVGVIPPATEGAPAGPLHATADDIAAERYVPVERETSAALGIALRILFVLAVLGVIGLTWYVTKLFTPTIDITVPNMVGKTYDEAQSLARRDNFTLRVSDSSDYNDQWPENQIYQQDPPGGRTVKSGKEVVVWKSLGPRLLTVPNMVGTTKENYTQTLQDANLPLGSATEEYSETVPIGVVIRQTPEKGGKVARNTAVSVVVSRGKQPPDTPGALTVPTPSYDKVELNWRNAARADSYTVERTQDGNPVTIGRGLTGTHFDDTGVKPDTTYSYTVTAINAAGQSSPSEPALVTTPPHVVAPPIQPPPVNVVPPPAPIPAPDPNLTPTPTSGPDSPNTPMTASRLRPFRIQFRIPRHPAGPHQVQFWVQDATGTNLVYEQTHDAGERLDRHVQGFGNKITLRIFLDGKLMKQKTL